MWPVWCRSSRKRSPKRNKANKTGCPVASGLAVSTEKAPHRVLFAATQVCKPGSVLTAIYLAPQLLTGSSRLLEAVGQTCCFSTALLRDRVYSVFKANTEPVSLPTDLVFTNPCYHGPGGLLPHLFTLAERQAFQWYLSVALVLRSPSAGVTRYPCPVEPGLSSSAAFRHASAAVRPGRGNIVLQEGQNVKCLAKSFGKRYTIR